jgi:hypothetical protein
MRKVGWISGAGLLVAMLVFIVQANKGFTADGNISIYGKVIDENGNAVKGIKARFTYVPDGKINKKILTNDTGEYRFENLSSGSYALYVENPFGVKTKLLNPEKHAFKGTLDFPYLYKSVKLKDTDVSVEVNFQLTLGVKVTGNITYEDGTPAKGIVVEAKNGYGTEATSKENGSYSISGILIENNSVSLKLEYDAISLLMKPLAFHNISKTEIVPATAGATITKNIQIRKMDQTKISLKGNIYVEGVLYDPQNKDLLEEKKVPYKAGPVFIEISALDGTYSYHTTMMMGGGGKYECYNLPPQSYKYKGRYQIVDLGVERPPDYPYRKGPIEGETEIEIPANGVVTMDINIITTPTERIEFIKK